MGRRLRREKYEPSGGPYGSDGGDGGIIPKDEGIKPHGFRYKRSIRLRIKRNGRNKQYGRKVET